MTTTAKLRKNLKHFDEMPNTDFVAFMDEVCLNGGVIPLKVNMKLDGCLIKFGKDENGIYVQTARSTKIYDPKEFIRYVQQPAKIAKWTALEANEAWRRARAYQQFMEDLMASVTAEKMKVGDYFVGELMCSYLGSTLISAERTEVKFVNVFYRKLFFREDYVLYAYDKSFEPVSDGVKFSFRDPTIYHGSLEIDENLVNIWRVMGADLRKSRLRPIDRWIMKKLKEDIAEMIFKHPYLQKGIYSITDAPEGIVIFTEAGKSYKIVTRAYRKLVSKK